MRKFREISENELQNIWIKQSFLSPLITQSGDGVSVLDVGNHNKDASGPDFKNSRIRIGNLVYVGDVEIDNDYDNWKSHGHNIDAKYNKVILHVCLINKRNYQYVYTKDGRKIPNVTLSNFIQKELLEKITSKMQILKEQTNNFLRCSSLSESVELRDKKSFVAKLGIERLNKKCEKIYQRLKELLYINELKLKEPTIKYSLHPDFMNKKFSASDFKKKILWQQLFYELLFESLGYSQNKEIMKKLARAINLNFIVTNIRKNNLNALEALFFNVAGMMPEVKNLPKSEISEHTLQLAKEWEKTGRLYDGKIFNETDWHFFRIRPQNFPTIRIIGGLTYVYQILYNNFIEDIVKKLEEIRKIPILINSLRSMFIVKSYGYWQQHYIFDQPAKQKIKYFIGYSRADEIVINVLLPFFMVYFEIFSKEEMSKKILKIYNQYEQRNDNKITREVAESLKLTNYLKFTVYSQGMIELYRNYCTKKRCADCRIGKEIFE